MWDMVKDLPDAYLFRHDGVFSRYNAFLDTFKRDGGGEDLLRR